MGKKELFILTSFIIISILLSYPSFGVAGTCPSHSDGFTEGIAWSHVWLVDPTGEAVLEIGTMAMDDTAGTSDFETAGLFNRMNYCYMRGAWSLWYQIDGVEDSYPDPNAEGGHCYIQPAYDVDYETSEFCDSNCFDNERYPAWQSTAGCCGNRPVGDCAIISSSHICYSDAAQLSWYWRLKSTMMGNIESIGCADGEFTTTGAIGTGFFVCDSSTTSIMGTYDGNSYLCSSANQLYECARTDNSHLNTVASGNLKLIQSSQSGYYCLATTPGASSTRWDNSPDCTSFCTVDGAGACCTDAGTLEAKTDFVPYVSSGLGCTYACFHPSNDCICAGWDETEDCLADDDPSCTTAETDNGTHCFMTTTAETCTLTGWSGCPALVEGADIDSSKEDCPGAEDGPSGDGYILPADTDICYYSPQEDSCSSIDGWICTDGLSDSKVGEIPSTYFSGGDEYCRYDLDTIQDPNGDGCLDFAGGWMYLDDLGKAYCVDNGEISPDGKCFNLDRTFDRCDAGIGWNCDNGTFERPDQKPVDCTYHVGACSQSGGKWNPDCTLYHSCTGEKCVADSGWECFGGVYAIEPAIDIDTSCTTCTDCDMNGDCDSEEISAEPWLDTDGDTELNVCEPDETPDLDPGDPLLGNPDYEDPGDECADGYDNDADGLCDYYGCECKSPAYCGYYANWDGTVDMPADPDCLVECNPCNECGFGGFNKCDIDECTSCAPIGFCEYRTEGLDFCCLDEDLDTFCEDNPDGGSAFGEGLNDPIEDQCNADPANPLTIFNIEIEFMDDNKDDDFDEIKDCLDEFLGCDLDGQCLPYGWGDEDCSCPDCNLSSFPCQSWPGQICIQNGTRDTWECMDWDENSLNCEMHDLLTDQENCDTGGEISCWDEPYTGSDMDAKCCGDDDVDDMWQEGYNGAGCSLGTFYLNPDNNRELCNYNDTSQDPGDDCWVTSQDICWYYEPSPACCGDDLLEYKTYNDRFDEGPNVACCPRNNDHAVAGGICFPKSSYLHPFETDASLTTAIGSEVGSLTDGELHPYNQTVTLLKAGDPLFEIEGQFSVLDRQIDGTDSIPPDNNGVVDLSGLRITDEGTSIYFNFTWLRDSRDSNRISDEYTVYIPNINFGIGITVCVDPQDPFTEAEYGDECDTATEFTRPRSGSGFTLEITEDYYKITTNLEDRYDWYAFVHVQPDLEIESDADLMTKRSFETVGFYAELKSGGMSIPDAACKLFYHDGLNVTMKYNETFEKYYYERTYSGKGLYEWEVKCSHPFYLPVSTSAMASIKPNSELIIYDITDSKTRMINETVDFFAFFRGLPDQNLIETASCNITFHEETSEMMTLDEDENGEKYFSEDRKYMNYGIFSYVVKCAEDGYDTMTTIDVVEIFPTICNVTRIDDEALVAGKANFNIISKRGFVLLKKAE